MKEAYFAAGSFWEAQLSLDAIIGVISTTVGYMGGFIPYPNYKDVISGKTGHAQTVKVLYDEDIVSYLDLVNCFFEIHDPTTLNKQGPDEGTAFRSILFYQTEEEKQIAQRAKFLYTFFNPMRKKAVSQICKAGCFYQAEDVHQHFIERQWFKLM
ncbi:MAG: peptide-methionine (S)-S-oxide reductase MsrA [Alphaproteobacteria bacterium]|nr:peptide-methionine (S)-S-oxide reductase MsrA [Alphaproteobacteria bacterium]